VYKSRAERRGGERAAPAKKRLQKAEIVLAKKGLRKAGTVSVKRDRTIMT